MKFLLFICLCSSFVYGSQENYQPLLDKPATTPKVTENPLYDVIDITPQEKGPKVSYFQRKESSHRRQGGGWIESLFQGWKLSDIHEGLIATKTQPLQKKF